MEKRAFDPTPWLSHFGMHHGIEITGAQRTLYLSGQTASAADGSAMHPGDISAQFRAAWKNLKDVLTEAGMTPENIVRLNVYTTDVDAFMAAAGDLFPVFAGDGCKPVSTLLGVARLYDPAILIELEATAVA